MDENDMFAAKPGEVIADRYVVTRHIGSGGTSDVFLVEDRILNDDKVALKLLVQQFAYDTEWERRLKREVMLARRLGHPNIVRMYDFGKAGREHCFVTMEFIEGINLRAHLENQPNKVLPISEAVRVLHSIATALAFAHSNDVIHRDLKPENIFLTNDAAIKLADFGSAKNISRQKGITAQDELIGTMGYMAPEQLLAKQIDARADIYALGLLGYEIASGTLPIEANSDLETALCLLEEGLPELKGVPWWYQEFISTCTELNPEDRFDSMSACVEMLRPRLKESVPINQIAKDSRLSAGATDGKKSLFKRITGRFGVL